MGAAAPLRRVFRVMLCALLAVSLSAVSNQIPGARAHHTAVYDGAGKRVLVYSGCVFLPSFKRYSDIWTYGNSGWQKVAETDQKRIVPGLAYDSKRKRVLMFGGSGDDGVDSGTLYALEGTTWKQVAKDDRAARGDFGMVYDSDRDRVVIYGGINRGEIRSDTWVFDGTTWSLKTTGGPAPAVAVAMAYDPIRKKTFMFGGVQRFRDPNAFSDATWSWDGKTWTRLNVKGPSARMGALATFDPVLKKIVVHGGWNSNGNFGDTWTFDGAKWAKISDKGPKLSTTALAYDPVRKVHVLFGGRDEAAGKEVAETWLFDSAKRKWTKL
jgi:hypothetical protein